MPNANYEAGRRFEYKIKKAWEHDGYIVFRTAGSHGAFDLIAVARAGRICFIQCKRVQTKAQARRLLDRFRENPPLAPERFEQFMAVYVAETRETLTGAA